MAMINPVEETTLFKSVSPYIKSISNETLMIELLLAAKATGVNWDSKNLDNAFTWMHTPQDDDFWGKLYDEHRHYEFNNHLI